MPDPTSNPLQPPAPQKASTVPPTVGRIVHVELPIATNIAGPIAAIVTRINSDYTIEASAFMPRATEIMPIPSLKHESQAAQGEARWRWPFRS